MGFGSAVAEVINNSKLESVNVKTFGYDDCFVEHGSVEELERTYGLTKEKIIKEIMQEE